MLKTVKSPCSNGSIDLHKNWHGNAFNSLNRTGGQHFHFLQIQGGASKMAAARPRPPFLKPLKSP